MIRKNVIILNGASSSGKTTLAVHLQKVMPEPYIRMSVDDFLDQLPKGQRPNRAIDADASPEHDLISAYHASIVAVVNAGQNVIVDHVTGEKKSWIDELTAGLAGHNVVFVGVKCAEPVLIERERSRTDRTPDVENAARQHAFIHEGIKYDVVIDTTSQRPGDCAKDIKEHIEAKKAEAQTGRKSWGAAGDDKRGYTHIYTGNGKGKTTAAAGLALRAVEAGWNVFVMQFIKSVPSGEMLSLMRRSAGKASVRCSGNGRFVKGAPTEADIRLAGDGLKEAREAMLTGKYRMMILDEICVACSLGLIGQEQVLEFMASKPANVELVLTGRNATAEMAAAADLVSEIREVKHYINRKVLARRGVEY